MASGKGFALPAHSGVSADHFHESANSRKEYRPDMDSGKWIRELREERFIKSSDIERVSRSIADTKGNAEFYVSHSTLADIETGSVPSIHKLFSLVACLKVSLEELLLAFGIEILS